MNHYKYHQGTVTQQSQHSITDSLSYLVERFSTEPQCLEQITQHYTRRRTRLQPNLMLMWTSGLIHDSSPQRGVRNPCLIPLYRFTASTLRICSTISNLTTAQNIKLESSTAGNKVYINHPAISNSTDNFQDAKDVEFKNACHVATNENSVGVQPQYDRLYQFKTEYPAQFNGLLESDWVIVHCAAGSNRSPPMTTAYAQMFSVAPKKNANQKIIFLKEGMDGYQKVDKKSEFCKFQDLVC